MSMKTDIWPFNPGWTGDFGKDELKCFNTSMWRPCDMCAVWEETFHTITEGYHKLASLNPSGQYCDWLYTEASKLGGIMEEDIENDSYETEEQNQIECGCYDFETQVNEYVHQVWLSHYSGHDHKLNPYQSRVLNVMRDTRGFPLRLSAEQDAMEADIARVAAQLYNVS